MKPPILVANLESFRAEIPTGVVRLSLSSIDRQSSTMPPLGERNVCLDLQALNDNDQVVWLHYDRRFTVTRGPDGKDEFFQPGAKSIYEGMFTAAEIVKDYLKELGYEVRTGMLGVPQDIVPLRAEFECLRWEKKNNGDWHVSLDKTGAKKWQETES